ncbi:hypothetical protein ELH62_00760 [Rhizobium ruizarguesonis]|nr:hypothetical protein ELH62_00760 [Rhizobium ruizarguesonis]
MPSSPLGEKVPQADEGATRHNPFPHNPSRGAGGNAQRQREPVKPRTDVGKTGFAGPLIRPTGTFSPRGEEGVERSRHVVRRTRRDLRLDPSDKFLTRRLNRPAHLPDDGDIRLVRASRLETKRNGARIGAFDR